MAGLVEVRGLRKRYGGTWALRGVDLVLQPGQILGLLGPNGAGKSTFIKVIAGVLHPTGGDVSIQGMRPGIETKRIVAYLPEVDHLYPRMTAHQAIRFMAAFFDDFDQQRAADLMAKLKVPADRGFAAMSRGQRTRFKLALTLARRASVLLLDEPLAGIDIISRDQILHALLAEIRTDEQAIVLATHEIGEAEALFDQVAFINDGEIVLTGAAEVLRSERGKSIVDLYRETFA